jgi:hypothetical protein
MEIERPTRALRTSNEITRNNSEGEKYSEREEK